MHLPNLKSVALPCSEIIAIDVVGWSCEAPILGNWRPYGAAGWYRSKERLCLPIGSP